LFDGFGLEFSPCQYRDNQGRTLCVSHVKIAANGRGPNILSCGCLLTINAQANVIFHQHLFSAVAGADKCA